MSVLFQALERAALEGRLQQQPASHPYLALERGAHRKTGWTLAFAAALLLSASLGAGGVTFYYGFYHKSGSENLDALKSGETNIATISADAMNPKAPPKAEQRTYLNIEEIPPDLAQGITLSAPSATAAVPDKDTTAVMQKLQDTPAFTETRNKRKPMKLEVRDSVSPELLKKAHLALTTEDYKGAITLYNQALADAPEHETALAGKAFALQQLGRYAEAVAIEQVLFERNPNDFAVKSNYVEALAALGTPESVNSLHQLLDKQPAFAPAHAALAKVLATGGKQTEAVPHLQRAIELEPHNASYRLSLAILYDRAEQHAEALSLYRQVLEMKDSTTTTLPLTWIAIEQRIAFLAAK